MAKWKITKRYNLINSSSYIQRRIYTRHAVNDANIVSGNGLSPIRRQAITWTNAGLLSIGLLGTSFSEILIWILSFPFKIMHLKMSSAKMAAILSRAGELNK